jgi:hypothetical protein
MKTDATIRQSFMAQVSLLVISALWARPALADDGPVLPATATPAGYSLADMAAEMAYFSTSGNNSSLYPDTPFQVLYVDSATGTNTFTVRTGTKFFVPLAFIDDSPPILGDFPTDPSEAADYVFSPMELGAHDLEIVVDGQATSLGPDYVAGPVFAPGLLDGGGSHFIQIGAFLTPLAKGTHTVTIQGVLDGDAIGGVFAFQISYTVIVQ